MIGCMAVTMLKGGGQEDNSAGAEKRTPYI